jgi:hypothetical protein
VAIIIGSHGCDCFTHSALVVDNKPNGASVIHSIKAFIEQLALDSGGSPKPVFIDACASGKYVYGEYNYPEVVEGHIDAPMLADAQQVVLDFILVQTLAMNLLI